MSSPSSDKTAQVLSDAAAQEAIEAIKDLSRLDAKKETPFVYVIMRMVILDEVQ